MMRDAASSDILAVWKRAAPRNRMREIFTSGSVGGLAGKPAGSTRKRTRVAGGSGVWRAMSVSGNLWLVSTILLAARRAAGR